jgi:hypothetical protein
MYGLINLNQELYLDVIYSKSPDEIFYSLIIEYKNEVVKSDRQFFSRFNFKISNFINALDSDSN